MTDFCPYCQSDSTSIGAGDESWEWCKECDRLLEGIETKLQEAEGLLLFRNQAE